MPAAIYGESYLPAVENPPPVELRIKVVDEATGKVSSSGSLARGRFPPW